MADKSEKKKRKKSRDDEPVATQASEAPVETQASMIDLADTGGAQTQAGTMPAPMPTVGTEAATTGMMTQSTQVRHILDDIAASRRKSRKNTHVHDRRLGAELVQLPEITDIDPADAVLADPVIAPSKRLCWSCGEPVGRKSGRGKGPLNGNCWNCGSRYSFVPGLKRGTMVADQYEIAGAIAHGGMGWIYLAVDHNVSDRPVVLKGLLNSSDSQAQAVAISERQFLASVNDPGIVKIFNFVEWVTDDGHPVGYIVMEYIGGHTLKQLTTESGKPKLLPIEQAMAYILEVLSAVGYLHSVGLVYNDVKPDNIMITSDEVKLIDMGAVSAINGIGHLYGTPGFQAPEIVQTGPQIVTDIYSIGRTLAVLTVPMPMTAGRYDDGLPDPAQEQLFVDNPSFYFLLQRSTSLDPSERFASAEEMTTQVLNVLRETVALHTGVPRPSMSTVFTPQRSTFGTELLLAPVDGFFDPKDASIHDPADIARALPVPLVDPSDPAAGVLTSAALSYPRQTLDTIRAARADGFKALITSDRSAVDAENDHLHPSVELDLAEARAHLELGNLDTALQLLREVAVHHGDSWKLHWYLGICSLLNAEPELAFERFHEVLEAMPGEVAPKLAVAGTAELIGYWLSAEEYTSNEQLAQVERWYEIARQNYHDLWLTDHAIVSAAFGLARMLLAEGRFAAAIEPLDEVPTTSRHYGTAQISAIVTLVHGRASDEVTRGELFESAERFEEISWDDPRRGRLQLIILGTALGWIDAHLDDDHAADDFLGFPFNEHGLRVGTERSLRELAKATRDNRAHRFLLVDLANLIRPATLF
ncbi:serine/threonine-protein kinase [Gordonia hydrophobica]|uniref:Serine/threonine-protein kinase PknG n=1 Tax=Gordonia hydrophobica TaxID=40516 RepID=A0ABZ2U762_9ACTN|nr:serine/threonine-protein kinase [Gordonia hydrophobica]MBM7365550.1 serine/threonine-protein kinase PknG [Gordonia hydrophobica]